MKKGFSYGATDEFGYKAVENIVTVYDLHATILHLLGLDHERLTYLPQRPRTPPDRRAWPGRQRASSHEPVRCDLIYCRRPDHAAF